MAKNLGVELGKQMKKFSLIQVIDIVYHNYAISM